MSMVVLAVLGTVLTRVLINDSRFVSRQDAMMSARQSARAALNTVVNELRMVSDEGLIAAAADSIRFRMPFVFGMACRTSGTDLVVSLTPADSLMYANAVATGIALRSGNDYTFASPISVGASTEMSACTQDSIRVIPGGRLAAVSGLGFAPAPGTLFYLYQDVRYRFRPSAVLTGRRALWRRGAPGGYEELVAPFDTSAGFRCLVGPGLDVVSCASLVGDYSSVRGLELRLVGASEHTPRGDSRPQLFDLTTRVTFLNKVN